MSKENGKMCEESNFQNYSGRVIKDVNFPECMCIFGLCKHINYKVGEDYKWDSFKLLFCTIKTRPAVLYQILKFKEFSTAL